VTSELEPLSEFCKIAIVAALEREVWPLVKNWHSIRKEYDGRSLKFFEKGDVVVVCGGIGGEPARRAAEAVIALYDPALVISAGFAGALDPTFEVGQTFTARQVIDARDGSHIDWGSGNGVLISFSEVADVEQKAKLRRAYGAHAVDMEAAAVARSAEVHGVRFLACKVISDSSASSLPPLTRFASSDGKFHTLKFLAHIAVRPWLWARVQKLASDSSVAAGKLSVALAEASQAQVSEKVLTR